MATYAPEPSLQELDPALALSHRRKMEILFAVLLVVFLSALDQTIVGATEVPLDGIREHVRTEETNEGNLIADALLWQARQLAVDFGVPEADIAIQNGGGIRNDSVLPAGDLTRSI